MSEVKINAYEVISGCVFLCVCEELHLLSDLKVIKRGFRISFPFKLEIWDLNKGPGNVANP